MLRFFPNHHSLESGQNFGKLFKFKPGWQWQKNIFTVPYVPLKEKNSRIQINNTLTSLKTKHLMSSFFYFDIFVHHLHISFFLVRFTVIALGSNPNDCFHQIPDPPWATEPIMASQPTPSVQTAPYPINFMNKKNSHQSTFFPHFTTTDFCVGLSGQSNCEGEPEISSHKSTGSAWKCHVRPLGAHVENPVHFFLFGSASPGGVVGKNRPKHLMDVLMLLGFSLCVFWRGNVWHMSEGCFWSSFLGWKI